MDGRHRDTLRSVPGSVLDKLSREVHSYAALPVARFAETQSAREFTVHRHYYFLKAMYVKYPRAPFEYLIGRLQQLGCCSVGSEPPPATIPSHMDKSAIVVLAELLGVSVAL